MGLRLLRTSLSPLLSSPHRIPLLFPYPSSPSLSSLVVWADPQSISPQRQPQKDYVYCIYNLYMVLMVLSHTRPHGVLPTYTSKRHPLYCAIHRMSSLNHRLGGRRTDGRARGSSSSLGRWCPLTVFTLCSHHSSVGWSFVFLQRSCCWMDLRKTTFLSKEQQETLAFVETADVCCGLYPTAAFSSVFLTRMATGCTIVFALVFSFPVRLFLITREYSSYSLRISLESMW